MTLTLELDEIRAGVWRAKVPDLPGLVAEESTKDAAFRRIAAMAHRALAELIETGQRDPSPIAFRIVEAPTPAPEIIRVGPSDPRFVEAHRLTIENHAETLRKLAK